MEEFLRQHSEFYRTLSEFPEGTTLDEVIEQASCTTDQLAVLMQLKDQKEDIYEYAFGGGKILYKSLKGQNISQLLRIAEFLILPPEIIRKLKIQLGAPETLRMLVPYNLKIDFEYPMFWIFQNNVEGLQRTFSSTEPDEFYCMYAAKFGSLECLEWLHQHGCPWDKQTCAYAADYGQLECIKYLYQHGCSLDTNIYNQAAKAGNLEILQWAHDNGCPWNDDICRDAAEEGQLECLQWAYNNGCPWDEQICSFAAIGGHLDCLKWAHENGCPWDESTCTFAAKCGKFECLKWAHQHGCPWDKWICNYAAESGKLEILKWLRANDCQWQIDYCLTIAKNREMRDWIMSQREND